MSNNADRLEALLGFDAAKPARLSSDLFKEVVDELQQAKREKARDAAREQLKTAMELREKMVKVRREFEAQEKKFDKELGSLISRIESGLSGRPAPTEEKEE